MLAARIRARVRIGQTIELLSDSAEHANLKRGALGLVSGFSRDGKVVVTWDDGLVAILDPSLENYERIGLRHTPRPSRPPDNPRSGGGRRQEKAARLRS